MADEVDVTVTDNDPIAVQVMHSDPITVQITQAGAENYVAEKFTDKSGADVELSLANTFRSGSCMVFLNGVLLEKDSDYTEGDDRDKVTISLTLETSDKVEVRYVVD